MYHLGMESMLNQFLLFFAHKLGKKYLMAVSGLALSMFVLMHMLGNLLILVSAKKYNLYGHAITSNPLILYTAEIGLITFFFLHIIFAFQLTWENRLARPHQYALPSHGVKGTSWVKKTLWPQGLLILSFTVLHLITFKYGPIYQVEYDGLIVRDLHRLVVEIFQQPIYIVWYIVCLIILGFHLSHGVTSALQTLGIHHPRYQKCFNLAGIVYGAVVLVGFLSQPVYVFLFYKG